MATALPFSSLLFNQSRVYVYSWPWWISRKHITPLNKHLQPFEALSCWMRKSIKASIKVVRLRHLLKWSLNSSKARIHLNPCAALNTRRDTLLNKRHSLFWSFLTGLTHQPLCDHEENRNNCNSRHSDKIFHSSHFENTKVSFGKDD